MKELEIRHWGIAPTVEDFDIETGPADRHNFVLEFRVDVGVQGGSKARKRSRTIRFLFARHLDCLLSSIDLRERLQIMPAEAMSISLDEEFS